MKYLFIHATGLPYISKNTYEFKGFRCLFRLDGSLIWFEESGEDYTYDLDTLAGPSQHILYEGDYNCDNRSYKQYDALESYVKYCILRYPNVKICGAEYADEKYEKGFDVSTWLHNIGVDRKNAYHA